jgi:hypothetical protein
MNKEELKALKKGQWIFTCSMEPRQFDCFDKEKNPEDYNREKFTDEQWEMFSKYDAFTTMEGSSHSVKNCSCNTISEAYALWFIKNKCWGIFDELPNDDKRWVDYENRIKELCERDEITYEGI